MKEAVKEIVGKRIKGVVIKSKNKNSSDLQVFLIFSDDIYYEFWSSSDIHGAGGIDRGGLKAVRNYIPERNISLEFINEDIKEGNNPSCSD